MAISIGVGLLLHFFLHMEYHMFVQFLIIGVIVVITYGLCTIFITFKKDERKYYVSALARVMHLDKFLKKDNKNETKEIENKE